MGPLVHPTNRNRFWCVRPFVRIDFGAFPEERLEGIACYSACWCILTTFLTDYILVMVCWFSFFWRHFDLVKRVNLWFPGISRRKHKGNSLKYYMLMYHDDCQNWFDYGQSLLINIILAHFYLVKRGFASMSWRMQEGMVCIYAWYYTVCWFF